jgi:Protein of unknown function (DUF3426)
MLVAAAAAIGDDFAPLPEPKLVEAELSPPGDLGYVEASSVQPDPLIFDESGIANLDPAGYGTSERADATAGAEEAGAYHEIYFVDLDPDNPPVIPENVAADQTSAPEIVDPAPQAAAVPDAITFDTASDGSDATLGDAAGSDETVVQTPLAPTEEQLNTPTSESVSFDEQVTAPANSKWMSDYLVPENMQDETSAPLTAEPIEPEPVAGEEATSGSAWASEDSSAAMAAPEPGAALTREPRPDARRWIVLRANNSGTTASKKATDVALRNALQPSRNLPVPSRGWHPPAPRHLVPRWPVTRLQAGIVALALLDFLLVGWRTDIVRKLPQTASFYELAGLPVNLRGLAFHGITTSTIRDGGKPVLVVEGNIVNNTAKALRVPQIRFAVRDAADQEIYFWTAAATKTSLPPGQVMPFRARLASPPAGARDVVLRFVNRRDAIAMNP